MLRQLSRVGYRAGAAAASHHHQLLDPLQQAPLWSDVLHAAQQVPLWQRAAWGPCQAAAGAAAAPRRLLAAAGQQQQSWRAYQSGYDQARNKNKKGIVDGSMYLVRTVQAFWVAVGSPVTAHQQAGRQLAWLPASCPTPFVYLFLMRYL
jgi:hypothetical protein